MITIFNARELMLTYSMDEQAKIREILRSNGIDYRVKTKYLLGSAWGGTSARARGGTFGIDHNHAYEYKIYVKKQDHDAAVALIRKR